MTAKRYTTSDFNQKRLKESWTRVAEFDDFQEFSNFVNYSKNEHHMRFGKYAMVQVKKFSPEVEKEAASGTKPEQLAIFLDEGTTQNFVSLHKKKDNLVLVWSCEKSEEDQPAMGLHAELTNVCRGRVHGFKLDSKSLVKALEFLDRKKSELINLNGTPVDPAYFPSYIQPLLVFEKESTEIGDKPWRFVLETPNDGQNYNRDTVAQFCSGDPRYDRLVLTFSQRSNQVSLRLEDKCVDSAPDLRAITSAVGGHDNTLEALRTKYNEIKVQRIAILGAARIMPYLELKNPLKPEEGYKDDTDDRRRAVAYTSHVQSQVDELMGYMETNDRLYTTVNGGWAGVKENSMGAPMMSNLMGATSKWADTFFQITVMPTIGNYDRVVTREEDMTAEQKESGLYPGAYFEVEGVWGDDSKFLVGISTALLVFAPYGFWTNIEIANGIAQGKPVAVMVNPDHEWTNKDDVEAIKSNTRDNGQPYVEREWTLPDGMKRKYRMYLAAERAAEWFVEEFYT